MLLIALKIIFSLAALFLLVKGFLMSFSRDDTTSKIGIILMIVDILAIFAMIQIFESKIL